MGLGRQGRPRSSKRSDAGRLARNQKRRPRERCWHMIFFCPIMSWETAKVLLSMLVSSEVPNSNIADDEELEMAVFEIFRTYFMAPIDRKACKNIQKRTFCQRMETRLESCGDRCVGSERRVRLGEEIGRRQSARLVTLLVRQTPRSSTTKPKGADGQYTAMMSLLFQVRQSTGPSRPMPDLWRSRCGVTLFLLALGRDKK